MAATTNKSAFLLLIITLVFSSYGVVEGGFWSFLLKKAHPVSGKKLYPTNPKGNGFVDGVEFALRKSGEKLANKFFGPDGEMGFRWGWKATKYYLKVDKRCEEYEQQLKPYCIPQTNYNLRPDCVVKCIVVTTTNSTVDNTPTLFYDSCDDPIEAMCNETVTNAECAKLING